MFSKLFGGSKPKPATQSLTGTRAPSGAAAIAKPPEAVVDSKLFQFDPEFSVAFHKLHAHCKDMIQIMGDDIPGDQILADLSDPGVGGDFKSKAQLAPYLCNLHTSLVSVYTRLVVLIKPQQQQQQQQQQQEDTSLGRANELASVMFFVTEHGSTYDQTSCGLVLDMLFSTNLLQPVIGGGAASNTSSPHSVKFALLLREMMGRLQHRLGLTATARALGRFARLADASSRGDFVRFEISRAMEWLRLASHVKHRLAAVLILTYLCQMTPRTKEYSSSFFALVGSALMDANKHTRFAARDALHTFFLAAIKSKDDREYFFKKCYSMIISPTHANFGESIETVHGSLLVVGELLNAPSDFIKPSLTKICQIVFDLKDHENPLVVRALLSLTPKLFSSYKDILPIKYQIIALELVCAKALMEKDFETNKAALLALSLLVEETTLREVILAHIRDIIAVLTRGFSTVELAPTALQCFGVCAKANLGGELLGDNGLNLLDDAFLFGLEHACSELLFALQAFVDNFSDSIPLIRARLIHEISLCLCGKPFEVLDPSSLLLAVSEDEQESGSQEDLYFFISILRKSAVSPLKTTVSNDKQELQREALKALATFDFGRLNLLSFLETELIPLIVRPNAEVQKEALMACFNVLKKDIYWEAQVPISIKYSSSKWEIIKACLTCCANDRDPDVRLFACEILWEHSTLLQMFLCTEHSLNLLFALANDLKLFKIRIVAIKLLALLSENNPSLILPFLRKFVMAQVNMMRCAVSKREELSSCLLLDTLIRNLMFRYQGIANDLLQPFLEPIVKDLLSKLKQILTTNGLVTTHLIQLLGGISQINNPIINPLLQEAIPILVPCAFDSTALLSQREAALATLTELLKKTNNTEGSGGGTTLPPPSMYPELIEPLLHIISGANNSAHTWTMQTEALRTLGTLGALDPATVRASNARRLLSADEPASFDDNIVELVGEHGWNIIAVGKAKAGKRGGHSASHSNKSFTSHSHNNHLMLMGKDHDDGGMERESDDDNDDAAGIGATEDEDNADADFADDSSEDENGDGEYSEAEALLPVRGPITEFGNTTQQHFDFHFRAVAIEALIRIMNSNSLCAFHLQVVDAAGNMCRSLKSEIVPYLDKLVPAMIHCLAASSSSWHLKRNTIRQLNVFVAELNKHMRPYVKQILFYVKICWDHVLLEALALVEEISDAFKEEFMTFSAVQWVVPRVALALGRGVNRSDDGSAATGNVDERDLLLRKAVKTCVSLRLYITESEYAYHVSALLITLLESNRRTSTKLLVLDALISLGSESLVLDSVSLFQCLPAMFNGEEDVLVEPSLRLASLLLTSNRLSGNQAFADAFRAMLTPDQLEMLNKVGESNLFEDDARHDSTEAGGDGEDDGDGDDYLDAEHSQYRDNLSCTDFPNTLNSIRLREVADISQVNTEDDWTEWLRRLSVELLRESPDPTLRACATVAQAHNPLARDLFNAAFVSCYGKLSDDDRGSIVNTFRQVFKHSKTPPDVMQMLLNLCEFMEQNQRRLPIDNLADYAIKCHAYAKALHYREMEFRQTKNSVSITVDDLIAINHRLERNEAAQGLLIISSQNENPMASYGSRYSLQKRTSNVIVLHGRETWHEQLGRFRDALESYQSKLALIPEDGSQQRFEMIVGKMRCLLALGEYDQLAQLGKDNWKKFDHNKRRVLAPLIAHGIWESGDSWRKNDQYMKLVNDKVLDGAVLNVVAKIQTGEWTMAKDWIDKARRILAPELTSSVSESYSRAYHQVVVAQQLVELEEVALLLEKRHETTAGAMSKRADIAQLRSTWDKRLTVCQKSVKVYQQLLAVRRLLITPEEDMKICLKFVSICRREERWGLGRSILRRLGVVSDYGVLESLKKNCNKRAIFSALKLSWVAAHDDPPAGSQKNAFHALSTFVEQLSAEEDADFVSKCRLTLAEWTMALRGEDAVLEAMEHVKVALNLDTGNKYKAAHAWASLNFVQFEKEGDGAHLEIAIQGFFNSIALGKQQGGSAAVIIQDLLRLLTLWFFKDLRAYPRAVAAVRQGFASKSIPVGTWLSVIPQLIARIQSNPIGLRDLLVELGTTYPQALVYPLTVAARSTDERVSLAADGILNKLRTKQAVLLDQANLVAKEMTRIAILLPEEWYEALEDAAKLWYTNANNRTDDSTEAIKGRLRAYRQTQQCLHDLNSRLLNPNLEELTTHEREFLDQFGGNLERAARLMLLYEERCEYLLSNGQKSNHTRDAWTLYKQIFAELGHKYLPSLSHLDLQEVSPKLLSMKDLELCVPGVFRANDADDLVKIRSFGHRVKVFKTKQRPRRIALLGSNGLTYRYLLKGREDLRQDERAMQLFSLVNVLLSKTKRNLSIQSYVVVPLSEDVGLIGWLPQTDTLHSLIRGYRAEKDVPITLEQTRISDVSPFHPDKSHFNEPINEALGGNVDGYDRLTVIQKVEAFQHALQSTDGDDLANIMWFKSKSAEVWLDRRTNYVRSLATMSMVGYVLGLGDRHPSNIMLHRTTGKIVHIDFGDCFEVAMHRERFPELVPFRLTRMLVNAMDVCGVEGDFRLSCETVMDVLRENRDSVMAMMEAFVHDPLMSWKLIAEEELSLATAAAAASTKTGDDADGGNGGGSTEDDDDEEAEEIDEEDLQHFLVSETPTTQAVQQQQHDESYVSFKGVPIPARPTSTSMAPAMSSHAGAGTAMDLGLSQSFRGPKVTNSRLRKSSKRRIVEEEDNPPVEELLLNRQAVMVVRRVKDKLTGYDFNTPEPINSTEQVERLIQQATSNENLCGAFQGWCSFW